MTALHYRLVAVIGFLLACYFFLLPLYGRTPWTAQDVNQPYQHADGVSIDQEVQPEGEHLNPGAPGDGLPAEQSPYVETTSAKTDGIAPISTDSPGQHNSVPESEQCDSRFGEGYIKAFTRTATQYCDSESTGNLTCFSHRIGDKQTDSFCIGGPALMDYAHKGSVHLDCKVRDLDASEKERNIPAFDQFPSYWYGTGPRAIFTKHMTLEHFEELPETKDFMFIVQREDNNENLWHTMMEIMSLTHSLDVLRLAENPSTGKPYFTDADVRRSQVVFSDKLDHGPYWDLWRIFADRASIRLTEVSSTLNIGLGQIVIPLPGGSNPFWQSQWVDISCGESFLMKTFADRVLEYYDIPKENSPRSKKPLTITLVDRRTKRRLLNQDEHFTAMKSKYPDLNIELVDFSSLPLREQIRVAHSTDILVGVHGAGLTHGMFLPRHSALVEILPPSLDNKGFANMAKFLGHKHFAARASKHDSPNNNGDWQHDDVFIARDDFMAAIDKAVSSIDM